MTYREGAYTLVYSFAGKVAHIVDVSPAEHNANSALCGVSPAWDQWYGVASQKELDKAKTLPLCKHCERLNG